jgi:hypothetical protein
MAYDTNRRHRPNSEGQSGKEDRGQKSAVGGQLSAFQHLYLGNFRGARPPPRGFSGHVARPTLSIPLSVFINSSTTQPLPGPNESEKARLLCTWGL